MTATLIAMLAVALLMFTALPAHPPVPAGAGQVPPLPASAGRLCRYKRLRDGSVHLLLPHEIKRHRA